jgi:hypothetical protein
VSAFLKKMRSAVSVVALVAFLHTQLAWGMRAERLTPGALPVSETPAPQPGIPAQAPSQPTPPAAAPQQPAPRADQTTTVIQVPLPSDSELEITVVEGEDGSNVVGKKSSSRPLVTVRDGKKQAIEGAVVTFIAPADGPSVVFGNGLRTATVLTDAQGQARVPVMKAVNAGSFKLQVSASFQGQIVNAAVSQTNYDKSDSAAPKTKGSAKVKSGLSGGMLAVIIGGGAAAAIGIGLGLGGKGSSSGTTTTTTSATIGGTGTPTVGAPH